MKSNKNNVLSIKGRISPKAKAGSSNLLGCAKLDIPKTIETLELRGSWAVIPAVEWVKGVPHHYRILRRKVDKRSEKGVNGKRAPKKRGA
jgi:hypothetical protein